MDRPKLEDQKREVLGKKVKNLRKPGFLPANVFGHNLESCSITVDGKKFTKLFTQVGETGLVDLVIDDAKARPVLIRNLQIDPVYGHPLHADLYQVNLSEKTKVNVPLEIIGEALAVANKIGLLLNPVTEIEVEALPENLPEKIEVDVSSLANIGESILVKDLKVPKDVEILTDPESIVATIDELVSKEVEEEAAAEEAEKAAEAAETEAAEEANTAEVEAEKSDTPIHSEE